LKLLDALSIYPYIPILTHRHPPPRSPAEIRVTCREKSRSNIYRHRTSMSVNSVQQRYIPVHPPHHHHSTSAMSSIRRAHLTRLRCSVDRLSASPRFVPSRLRAVPSAIFTQQPTVHGRPSVLARSTLCVGQRYASTAAAVKEVEEGEAEPEKVWPQRVLPELTVEDVKRLSRQRNIGM
jgi:hypothetical protein